MNPEAIEMLKRAMVPYRALATPGGQAIVLADHRSDPVLWEIFAAAAEAVDMNATVIVMPPLLRDYDNPPAPVQAAVLAADLVHYVTTRAIVHSRFGREVSRKGIKKIISEQITREMLRTGAILVDPAHLNEANRKFNEAWDNGSLVHITTAIGTDLTMSIAGRKGFMGADNAPKTGYDLGTAPSIQFPGGEAPVAPVEDSAEGVLIVDKTMHHPEGLLKEPVRLDIHEGTITKISGGEEAKAFEEWLASFGDEGGYRLCEVSCGTNDKAVWMGSMRQDRYVLGGMHVGFGLNVDVGGTIDSNIHYDLIFSRCTLEVDGRLILKDGELVV